MVDAPKSRSEDSTATHLGTRPPSAKTARRRLDATKANRREKGEPAVLCWTQPAPAWAACRAAAAARGRGHRGVHPPRPPSPFFPFPLIAGVRWICSGRKGARCWTALGRGREWRHRDGPSPRRLAGTQAAAPGHVAARGPSATSPARLRVGTAFSPPRPAPLAAATEPAKRCRPPREGTASGAVWGNCGRAVAASRRCCRRAIAPLARPPARLLLLLLCAPRPPPRAARTCWPHHGAAVQPRLGAAHECAAAAADVGHGRGRCVCQRPPPVRRGRSGPRRPLPEHRGAHYRPLVRGPVQLRKDAGADFGGETAGLVQGGAARDRYLVRRWGHAAGGGPRFGQRRADGSVGGRGGCGASTTAWCGLGNRFAAQNESERTTVLYALLRYCTPLQVRFFMTVLEQMAKRVRTQPEKRRHARRAPAADRGPWEPLRRRRWLVRGCRTRLCPSCRRRRRSCRRGRP